MISTKGRYALRVMIDLAEHRQDRPVPLKEIAERQGISKKYLEIIMKDLVEGNLVRGSSGKGGGYVLRRGPEEISVGEIVEQMEGSLAPVQCLETGGNDCGRCGFCTTLPLWTGLDRMMKDYLSRFTLQSLIDQAPFQPELEDMPVPD